MNRSRHHIYTPNEFNKWKCIVKLKELLLRHNLNTLKLEPNLNCAWNGWAVGRVGSGIAIAWSCTYLVPRFCRVRIDF